MRAQTRTSLAGRPKLVPTSHWGTRLLVVLGLGLALAGCQDAPRALLAPGGAKPNVQPPTALDGVGSVTVRDVSNTVSTEKVVNDQFQMSASANDREGRPLTVSELSVVWESTDATVASIQPTSPPSGENVTVTALKEGVTYISAIINGVRSNSFKVTVREASRVTRIELTPSAREIGMGGTVDIEARIYDQYGQEMGFPTMGLWEVDNPGIAYVSSAQHSYQWPRATVTGVAMGATAVRFRWGQLVGTATVTVRPFVLIDGPYHISEAGTYTFTAGAWGGNGAYTYQWTINTGSGVVPLGTGQSQTVYFDQSHNNGNTVIGVQVTSAGGTGTDFKWPTVAIGCGNVDWCG